MHKDTTVRLNKWFVNIQSMFIVQLFHKGVINFCDDVQLDQSFVTS